MQGAREHIKQAVLAWEGVTAHSHRFGGTEYRLGRREIGHIHGDYLVDIPFPKKVRDELVAAQQAEPERGFAPRRSGVCRGGLVKRCPRHAVRLRGRRPQDQCDLGRWLVPEGSKLRRAPATNV